MILVPTGELTGVLGDVIPFACPDDDLPTLNCVRIEWDGAMLHTLATDRFRIAWSMWHPDDQPDLDSQDDLFTTWGGADDPWQATICLDDAKELVKVFKLPSKEQRVPLALDLDRQQVTVRRDRDTGYTALRLDIPDQQAEFPDVRTLLSDSDRIEPVTGLMFNAKYLADFSKVRPRSPLQMSFTGSTGIAHVSIGKRFTGAIMPVREGETAS
jgi:DNA polymerase III sliding clamp (beta) subunit (PCNA family)